MSKRYLFLTVAVSIWLSFAVAPVSAQEMFYKDKTIRIIVGYAPGGGFDTYAQVIARHMGKHIPGNPTISVQNMPGDGSMIAASYMYNEARPDGLTIGSWLGRLVMAHVLGREGIRFDPRKFEWIGSALRETPVCVLTKASGITSIDQWMGSNKPIKLGGLRPGVDTDDIPKILKASLGLPIELASGYKGTQEVRLAAERGEVAGGCWESIRAAWRKAIESGEVKVVLQASPKKHPDLPDVPNATDYVKTEQALQLIRVGVHDQAALRFVYSLPPGTPKEQVNILRKSFTDMMKDLAFLADTRNPKVGGVLYPRLDIDPVAGEEVENIIVRLFKLDPAVVAKLKDILK